MNRRCCTRDDHGIHGTPRGSHRHPRLEIYADALCRVGAEAWGSTWAEDGLWEMPDYPGMGTIVVKRGGRWFFKSRCFRNIHRQLR